VSHGGLLTAAVLTERIGLWPLVAGLLTVPGPTGVNSAAKTATVLAGLPKIGGGGALRDVAVGGGQVHPVVPSGDFNANAAWLALAALAHNLTRASDVGWPRPAPRHHRDHPADPDRCPGPAGALSPQAAPATTRALALADSADVVPPHQRHPDAHLNPIP